MSNLTKTLKPSDIRITLTSFALANIYNALTESNVSSVQVANDRVGYINKIKAILASK